MSDDGKKPGSPVQSDAIVAQARAAMADLFQTTIGAMSKDIEKTLSTKFTRGTEVEKAVTKVTAEMIKMLATQVASVLPQADAGAGSGGAGKKSGDPSAGAPSSKGSETKQPDTGGSGTEGSDEK